MSAKSHTTLSPRLRGLVDALPLWPGMRVVEIGCGPGAAARAVCERIGPAGCLLAVDRSPRAIEQITRSSGELIAAGRLTPRLCDARDLALTADELPYDLVFAIRVGVFDGRDLSGAVDALDAVSRVIGPRGRVFTDDGDQMREIVVEPHTRGAVTRRW